MAEYIDRAAAIHAVHNAWMNGAYYVETMNALKKLSSADIVAVVRCKDCKYWEETLNGKGYCKDISGFGRWWKGNDYCSYGEQK